MYKTFILLTILPFILIASEINVIANVNGEPISNLDIEKRINLINSLFNTKSTKEEISSQILSQIIDEIIIFNEAKKLNIKLNRKELNDAFTLFLTQNFKIESSKIPQYIKKYNIDSYILRKQIECQLLWKKIIEIKILPLIKINDMEINNIKMQIEKPDYFIKLQEFIFPNQINNNTISIEMLIKEINKNNNYIPKFPIKKIETIVNLNQLEDEIMNSLHKLEIGEISDLIKFSNKSYYSIIKIIDKIKIDYNSLESTLKIKQIIVKDDQKKILDDLLKENQKINCLNFNMLANKLNLSNVTEFKIKVRDLKNDLKILLNKAQKNEMFKIIENNNTFKLIIICDIKKYITNIEEIKEKMYQEKIIIQSDILLDNMRKNTAISYNNKY